MNKLLSFQRSVNTLSKDKTNPFFKSNYFDINGLLAEVRPLLNELELVISQPLTHINGKPAIMTVLRDGDTIIYNESFPLPDIQDPQKLGAAITYIRRYALQSLLTLQASDDDGNTASGKVSYEPVQQTNNTAKRW